MLLLLLLLPAAATASPSPPEQVLADIHSKLAKYDRELRPNVGGEPVVVGLSVYLLAVSSLQEAEMQVSVQMYFRQFWRDPRLQYDARGTVNRMLFGQETLHKIWKPDTFIVNQKSVAGAATNEAETFLRILPSGEILWSRKMDVTLSCPMDVSRFPWDEQLCSLELESFSHTMTSLRYAWQDGNNSVLVSPDVGLPDWNVLGANQRLIELSLSSGNYSRLVADLQLWRLGGHYINSTLLPAACLVIFSWLAFLLEGERTTDRLLLGLFSLLSLTVIFHQSMEEKVKISYLRLADIYLIVSIFLVFLSVCVTVGENFLQTKRIGKNQVRELRCQLGLDSICLIIFPLLFVIFNIWFWV